MPNEKETEIEGIKIEICLLLFQLWDKLPGPRLGYADWYYAKGRFYDLLNEELDD